MHDKTLNCDEGSNLPYTLRDFEHMKFLQILKYDKRSFLTVYWDSLLLEHDLISILFKKSIILPLALRIFFFFFNICLDFTTNAIFYTDQYISTRHTSTASKDFMYTFIHELPKSLWSLIITAVISVSLEKIVRPTKKIEEELNKSLVTGDLVKIRSS